VIPAKASEPIEMPFWGLTRVGPRNHILDRGPDPPRGRGNFWELSGPLKSMGNGNLSRPAHIREWISMICMLYEVFVHTEVSLVGNG